MAQNVDELDIEAQTQIDMIEKEADEYFIDRVKERRCLYDKSVEEYHDPLVRENAMEEIAYIMGDTGKNNIMPVRRSIFSCATQCN